MGKGNNPQKNDKKNLKPKQDKTKPAAKKCITRARLDEVFSRVAAVSGLTSGPGARS